jgi:hypothetical protein
MGAAVCLGFQGGEERRNEFHAVIPVTHIQKKIQCPGIFAI